MFYSYSPFIRPPFRKPTISPQYLYDKLQDKKIDLIALTGDVLERKRSILKFVPYSEVF